LKRAGRWRMLLVRGCGSAFGGCGLHGDRARPFLYLRALGGVGCGMDKRAWIRDEMAAWEAWVAAERVRLRGVAAETWEAEKCRRRASRTTSAARAQLAATLRSLRRRREGEDAAAWEHRRANVRLWHVRSARSSMGG